MSLRDQMGANLAQFSSIAPRDFLSPEYPRAGGLILHMGSQEPRSPGMEPIGDIQEYLARREGIRAWVAWLGDDGYLRCVARTRP